MPCWRRWRKREIGIPDDDDRLIAAGRYTALSFEFAGSVVAGVVAGYYLDGYLGTAPLFTLGLTTAGMGAALYRLLWNLKKFNSHEKNGS